MSKRRNCGRWLSSVLLCTIVCSAHACVSGGESWQEPPSHEEQVDLFVELFTQSLDDGLIVVAVKSFSFLDCDPDLDSVGIELNECEVATTGLTAITATVSESFQSGNNEGDEIVVVAGAGDITMLNNAMIAERTALTGPPRSPGKLSLSCSAEPAVLYAYAIHNLDYAAESEALAQVLEDNSNMLPMEVNPRPWSEMLVRPLLPTEEEFPPGEDSTCQPE